MRAMDELHRDLEALARSEQRVAMATLVATRGTTPKKEGAKMWVGEGGRILGSVTIGGCVDARVVQEAERAIASGVPALLSMSLGDDEAWDVGLTCGGTVDALVEPIDFAAPAGSAVLDAYDAVREDVRRRGRHAVLVTPLTPPDGSPEQ